MYVDIRIIMSVTPPCWRNCSVWRNRSGERSGELKAMHIEASISAAETPALGSDACGGPLAGWHDCHAAGSAGAGARGLADAGVRDCGRLAEPALLLARRQVWPAGTQAVLLGRGVVALRCMRLLSWACCNPLLLLTDVGACGADAVCADGGGPR